MSHIYDSDMKVTYNVRLKIVLLSTKNNKKHLCYSIFRTFFKIYNYLKLLIFYYFCYVVKCTCKKMYKNSFFKFKYVQLIRLQLKRKFRYINMVKILYHLNTGDFMDKL